MRGHVHILQAQHQIAGDSLVKGKTCLNPLVISQLVVSFCSHNP